MVQAERPAEESVLSGSQDVARCHYLEPVGRDLPGTDPGSSVQSQEAIFKAVYGGGWQCLRNLTLTRAQGQRDGMVAAKVCLEGDQLIPFTFIVRDRACWQGVCLHLQRPSFHPIAAGKRVYQKAGSA